MKCVASSRNLSVADRRRSKRSAFRTDRHLPTLPPANSRHKLFACVARASTHPHHLASHRRNKRTRVLPPTEALACRPRTTTTQTFSQVITPPPPYKLHKSLLLLLLTPPQFILPSSICRSIMMKKQNTQKKFLPSIHPPFPVTHVKTTDEPRRDVSRPPSP